MKKLKHILKWLLGTAVLIPVVVVILFYVFKKDIEAYGIKAVNNELSVPFSVKSYHANLWKTFPDFAFTVYDIKIEESYPIYNQPFAEAKEVSLVFNIFSVLNGNFTVKKVNADGLIARIGTAEQNNYEIFKSADSADESSSFHLEDALVSDGDISYWNKDRKLKIRLKTNQIQAALSIGETTSKYDIELTGKLVHYINKRDTTISNKKATLKTNFIVNEDLKFNMIDLVLEQSEVIGQGNFYSFTKDNPTMDLDFKSKDLTLVQLIPWLPAGSFDPNEYKSSGVVNAHGTVKGPLDNLNGLIEFDIKHGSLTQQTFDVELKEIITSGKLQFGKKEELVIHQFSAQLDDKPLLLSFKLTDFENPYIDVKAKADLSLEKVGKLTGIEQILKGLAKVDVSYAGLVKQLSNSKTADQWSGEGTVELINAAIFNRDQSKILSHLNGTFKVKSNVLKVTKLNGLLTESPFQFSGEIFPVATYLFTHQNKLKVTGKLHARHINYDKLKYIMVDQQTSTQKDEVYSLHKGISANLRVDIDSFSQGNFEGQQIKGQVLLANQILKLSNIGIRFYEGSLAGDLTVRQLTNGDFVPVGSFRCTSVPIKKLFKAFDNFGQDEITTKNLSGNLNATMDIAGVWDSTLRCDFHQFFALININILDGRLQNYEPLNAMARFVSVKKLMDIQFEHLKQSIEIKNNWIYLSPMEIKNNAVNLEILQGKHSLDNDMDYHFKIRVNDLLTRKYKLRQKRDETQYTSTSDGGMNLLIHMFGNADDLKFKYDRKTTGKVIKEGFKESTQTVKGLFRKELGLKSKDTLIVEPKHLEVDWDE
jgi:hypothetical protein